MNLPSSNVCIAASALLCLLACGDSSNQPLYSSGLDKTQRAATLNGNDKQQYCRTLDQHVNVVISFQEIARIACLPLALLSASEADCERKLDDCTAATPNPVTVTAQQNHDQACYDSLDACNADVGTLEGCVDVNVAAVRNVLETITCARFGDTTSANRVNNVMSTANACADTASSCTGATALLL